jgi:hypothetical protein
MMDKVRDMHEGMSAEDSIRKLIGERSTFNATAVRDALDRLIEILDEDPEIDVSRTSAIADLLLTFVIGHSRLFRGRHDRGDSHS